MTEWFASGFKSLMPQNHKYRGKGLNRSLYRRSEQDQEIRGKMEDEMTFLR